MVPINFVDSSLQDSSIIVILQRFVLGVDWLEVLSKVSSVIGAVSDCAAQMVDSSVQTVDPARGVVGVGSPLLRRGHSSHCRCHLKVNWNQASDGS